MSSENAYAASGSDENKVTAARNAARYRFNFVYVNNA